MRKTDIVLIAVATLLLFGVNWLAFHDFQEPHTVRDRLMLLASLLVFVEFVKVIRQRNGAHGSASKVL